jgi:beta-phosphoglucomutase-like phosphatase (HAD superfamily)
MATPPPFPHAIIFDMDGLLLDSEPLYQEAWQLAAQSLGYEIDDGLYMNLVGRSSVEADRLFLQIFGETFPVHDFNQRWESHWQALVKQYGVALKPGVPMLLDWLDQQMLARAVGTSSNQSEAELCLSLAGIHDRFPTIVTVEQVAAGKPAPDIFLEAARRLSVPPEDCLVLEDSNAGVEAAHAAGMTVVMVPDLQVPTPASAAIAIGIFSTLHEVLAWLKRF